MNFLKNIFKFFKDTIIKYKIFDNERYLVVT